MEESIIGIAKEVFEAFIMSETRDDFNKKLKELSLKYHKTSTFLRQIKDDYYLDVASKEEQNLYVNTKLRITEGDKKYKIVIDKLLSMTEEERIQFIKDEKLHRKDVNVLFNNYFKKKKNEDVYKLKEWMDNYFDSKTEIQFNDTKMKAYTYLEELVGNGYYYVGDYVSDFYLKHDSDKVSFKENMKYIMDFVKYNYPEMYEHYINKMEINRKIRFNTLKPNIDDFIGNMDNLDIVDYYIMFGIPINDFLRLCKGLIDKEYVPNLINFLISIYS